MCEYKTLSGDSAIFTLENAPIGLAHVNALGKFIYVNREFCNIAGWPREDLLQMGWPDITHPEDVMPDSAQVEALLRREMPSYQMDKRYLTKDDKTVWISLNVWALFQEGVFKHFIVAIEDITQRQTRITKLEKRLDEAISEINELNERFKNDRSAIRKV